VSEVEHVPRNPLQLGDDELHALVEVRDEPEIILHDHNGLQIVDFCCFEHCEVTQETSARTNGRKTESLLWNDPRKQNDPCTIEAEPDAAQLRIDGSPSIRARGQIDDVSPVEPPKDWMHVSTITIKRSSNQRNRFALDLIAFDRSGVT
jgi:hypothetical protein